MTDWNRVLYIRLYKSPRNYLSRIHLYNSRVKERGYERSHCDATEQLSASCHISCARVCNNFALIQNVIKELRFSFVLWTWHSLDYVQGTCLIADNYSSFSKTPLKRSNLHKGRRRKNTGHVIKFFQEILKEFLLEWPHKKEVKL